MIQVFGVHRTQATEDGVDRWTVEFLTGFPAGPSLGVTAAELPADVRTQLRAWLDTADQPTTKEAP